MTNSKLRLAVVVALMLWPCGMAQAATYYVDFSGGAGISVTGVDGVVVEKCYVHHCPGHTRGIVLHTCKNVSTRFCRLVKNTATAVDYYGSQDGDCRDNLVTDHFGMHSNGLTFYLGCKNLVIERNVVRDSNIGLTMQQAENVVIRNNLIDSCGRTMCVGIWNTLPLRNIQFLNNTLVRSASASNWEAAVFSNSPKPEGLVFRNNIIDGTSGNLPGTYENNLYTRWGPAQKDKKLGKGEVYELDLTRIFVDAANGDYHLRAGSPAIGAGIEVGPNEDLSGVKTPAGKTPDIGAYQFKP